MRFLPGNAQHIGGRHEQQDSFAFSDPSNKNFLAHGGLLAIVSDGMGGMSNGQQASSSAVRTFLAEYERKQKGESIASALHRSLQAGFEAVHSVNQTAGGQSGATLVAAVAHDRELYWVAVGDSRLYLVRRGKVVQLNRDHSYRERLLDQVASDQIRLEDALTHPEREHLTSYLGMGGSPEVDTNLKPFLLEPDDCVFICTDGVYRSLSDKEFAAAFEGANASRACEAIKSMVLARATPQQDNLTIVAFACDSAGGSTVSLRGMRSRAALIAACLLVCANLFAAGLAWKTWRSLTREQKPTGPSPVDRDHTEKKPSPIPPAKKDETPEEQPVGKDATDAPPVDQDSGGSEATESKPGGRDTAAADPNQKKDAGKKIDHKGNRKKSNQPSPDTAKKDTQEIPARRQ